MSSKRVVVLGSGAAGMAAAVAAARGGAAVTVLEATGHIGGTTAYSGGGIWIPANRWAAAHGVEDSPDAGVRYLRALELGDVDRPLCEAYVRQGPQVTAAVEASTPLRWQHLVGFPDYHAELDGGKVGGRSLEIGPVELDAAVLARVRPDPYGMPPLTINEEAAASVGADEVARREGAGVAVRGRGLIGALYATLRELGGEVRTTVRSRGLVRQGDAVVGVDLDGEHVQGEVVVATGGFERSAELVHSFLRGPLTAPASPPANTGDVLRMGMAAGAALGNMSEAWWCPAMHVPGETIDGAPFYRMLFLDCAKPGGLVVDSKGRRFTNEAANYNDLGRSLHDFDPSRYGYPRVPSWLVFDAVRHDDHALGFRRLTGTDGDWLARGRSLPELAAATGLDAGTLQATVERFNDQAARGVDDDFGRGSYAWDAFSGGGPLRPVSEPPFCAVRVLPGCLGTKGGLRTDEHGRVLHAGSGSPIPGLYAAGNAAANPFGCAYPGPGSTIGPALVFGWLAGEAAAASL
jgi:3-oxosteroid 1-dehydrogenase